MDWIASALNESVHTIVPPHMSSKDDLGDLSTPNFDRFLSSSGDKEKTKKEQHQNNKPSVPNPTSSTNNLTAPSVNKVNFSPSTGLSYPPPPNHHHNDITSGSQTRGPHPFDSVHHNPDLQRFLMMQQNFNQPNTSNNPFQHFSKQELMLQQHQQQQELMKGGGAPYYNYTQIMDKSSSSQIRTQSQSSMNSTGTKASSIPQSRRDSLASNNSRQTASSSSMYPQDGAQSKSTPKPITVKNDKAVQIHHSNRIIARFRTQTECARYLRATPEAVSYHCSKGGGVCNGIFLSPINTDLQRAGLQAQALGLSGQQPYYGLFDGAAECRPAQRPQLKPETVAILKEWLLSPDHMDNPYPNAHESEMLMSRTGLDRTQLKHWFNNARKRILKPLLKNGGIPSKKKKRGSTASSSDVSSRKKAKKTMALIPCSTTEAEEYVTELAHTSLDKQRQPHKGKSEFCGAVNDMSANKHSSKTTIQDMISQVALSLQGGHNSNEPQGQPQSMIDDVIIQNRARSMSPSQGWGDALANMIPSQSSSSRSQQPNTSSYNDYNPYSGLQGGLGGGIGPSNNVQQRQGGTMHGFGGCMDTNDTYGFHNRYNNSGDPAQGHQHHAQQDIQPISYPPPTNTNNNAQDNIRCNSTSAPQPSQAPPPPSVGDRSTAVFKQQVATMAMTEASTAFKEMEDAFAFAKQVLEKCDQHENDPRVLEANAHAKKCQSVAMFKLKVSQRASEEATAAYQLYQAGVDIGNRKDNDDTVGLGLGLSAHLLDGPFPPFPPGA